MKVIVEIEIDEKVVAENYIAATNECYVNSIDLAENWIMQALRGKAQYENIPISVILTIK